MTIVYFEIWNLIRVVSAIHDDEWLKPLSLTLKIVRFYLVLYDVINYNDVISAADSYESVKDRRFTGV